ncbi:MAG: FAD-dependent oxidoreductase, partial [Proteobacteria bacterium]|nr:FAD-dependent oxidoreductase [Pseudomonadota bacterium]
LADYATYLNGLVRRLPATVVLNKKATAEDIKNFGADYTIIATGAAMEPPPFDGENVLTATQVLSGREPQGEKILVMGGGIIGCETAIYLVQQGKQVTLSTRGDADALASDHFDHNNREMLLLMIRAANINVLQGTVPVRFEKDGVIARQNGSEKKIAVDNLVFAGRFIAERKVVFL